MAAFVSHVHHPIDDKDLFACPKCGGRSFTRIQTGYTQCVPCEILHDGKVAVCHYAEEDLEEVDDGAAWSRTLKCVKCAYGLTEEDLKLGDDKFGNEMVISQIDCVSTVDVGKELVAEHGKQG